MKKLYGLSLVFYLIIYNKFIKILEYIHIFLNIKDKEKPPARFT